MTLTPIIKKVAWWSILVAFVAVSLAQDSVITPKHGGPGHTHEDEHHHDDGEVHDACSAEQITSYNMPFHIAAIFIVMITSASGVFSSLILTRFPKRKFSDFAINIGKHFGTGVILATAFIHMFPGALFALTNPCVPTSFSADYSSYAGLFAMLAALVLQLIEFTASQYYKGKLAQSQPSVNAESEAKENSLHAGDHGHVHGGLWELETRRISTFLLEFGIALHSILIGISVGVSSGAEFVPLLIAVVFHQFFEGLALGARIGELTYTNRVVPYLSALFYALITPIGAAIGIGIHQTYNNNSPTSLLVTGIFDSISAGILIYMAFVNLIAVEFQNSPKFMKEPLSIKVCYYIALWMGAGVMALIGRWA
ncbi:hypothetical protein K7432_000403 [Basidiobolus ranarum]|uniref:ZIP zinc/iron transport family n=1 Tax=Basidiobolus ranarum TaxID=34480 RepID=A0ABR2X4N7_9FUNG